MKKCYALLLLSTLIGQPMMGMEWAESAEATESTNRAAAPAQQPAAQQVPPVPAQNPVPAPNAGQRATNYAAYWFSRLTRSQQAQPQVPAAQPAAASSTNSEEVKKSESPKNSSEASSVPITSATSPALDDATTQKKVQAAPTNTEEEKKARKQAQEELAREQLQSIPKEIVEFYSSQRMSSLMLAVIWGNINLVRSFLDNSLTDVNAVDAQGRNALMLLVQHEEGPRYWSFQRNFGDFKFASLDIARLLIARIDLTTRDHNGNSAFGHAYSHGHEGIVYLMQSKEEADRKEREVRKEAQKKLRKKQSQSIPKEIVEFYSSQRMSSLMLAVIWGNVDLVRSLLDNPLTDVNAVDVHGRNALMLLVEREEGPRYWSFQREFGDFKFASLDIARLLIARIDLTTRDHNGYTALRHADSHDHRWIAHLIRSKNEADRKEREEREERKEAQEYLRKEELRREESTREQLQSIPKEIVESYAGQKMTPLMLAVIWGNVDLVRSLLDNPSTDVNAVDVHGRNALMLLVEREEDPHYWSFPREFGDFKFASLDIARLLIARIDLTTRDHDGYTALWHAYWSRHTWITRLILFNEKLQTLQEKPQGVPAHNKSEFFTEKFAAQERRIQELEKSLTEAKSRSLEEEVALLEAQTKLEESQKQNEGLIAILQENARASAAETEELKDE